MKAVLVKAFGGPEVLTVADVADPVAGAGQVLVRIQAAGVNPVETYIRAGKYARLPDLPYTPGSDGAGRVEAVGPDVTGFAPGDRVYVFGSLTGTYAELALCSQSQVRQLSDRVSFAQGAAIGVPYATAWRALFHRGEAKSGDTILIHGATGGVGIAAIQFAVAAGLNVIGTAGSERGKELVRVEGAHHVMEHEEANDPARIMALTDGKGLDVILEMLANVNLNKDLSLMAKGGRIVVVGSRGPVEIDPRLAMMRESDIRGMTLMNATPDELVVMHDIICAGLVDGSLHPVIDQKIPFSEALRAHDAIIHSESYGKIVLVP